MDGCVVIVAIHGEAIPFDAAYNHMVDRIQEIVAMRLGVKANQIGSQ